MKRRKRLLAFVLAGVMITSNVAYAAPDTSSGSSSEVTDEIQLNLDNTQKDVGTSDAPQADDSKEEVKQPEVVQETEVEEETESTDTSEDEKKSEEVQKTEKQTSDDKEETDEPEVRLCEVSFTSPEKHGKILQMNDTEVKEGESLKADTNGNVQFKVKADDGYQVEKVVNKADGSQLTLIDESYYKLQIDENTTIEVHYKKIPAEDEAEDSEKNSEDTKNIQDTPQLVMNQAKSTEKIQITLNLDGNTEEREVSYGLVENINAELNLEDYDFVNATVDGIVIVELGKYEGRDFYRTEQDAVVFFDDQTNVIFNYTKHLSQYNIALNYDSTLGSVECNITTAKETEKVPFSVKANQGYRATVSSDAGTITDKQNGNYELVVDEVEENATVTITIQFEQVETYNIKFEDNTYIDSAIPATVEPGGQFTFKTEEERVLRIGGQYKREIQYLSINGEVLDVSGIGSNQSKTFSSLECGATVNVERKDRNSGIYKYRQYIVTISNIWTDLDIVCRVRDDGHDIVFQSLDGMTVYASKNGSEELQLVNEGDVFSTTSDDGYVFYVKTSPGYLPQFSTGGSGFKNIDPIGSEMSYTKDNEAKALGCDWEFHYSKGNYSGEVRTVHF